MTAGKEERETQWRKALDVPLQTMMSGLAHLTYMDILVERAIEQANKELGPLFDEMSELREQARVVREGDHPPYSTEEFLSILAVSRRVNMHWKEYVHHVVVTAVKKDLEAIAVADGGEDG